MNKNINRNVVISTQQQWNPYSFHAPFSKIEHMEGNKTSHNTLKSNELVHSMWSDHSGITLQIIEGLVAPFDFNFFSITGWGID